MYFTLMRNKTFSKIKLIIFNGIKKKEKIFNIPSAINFFVKNFINKLYLHINVCLLFFHEKVHPKGSPTDYFIRSIYPKTKYEDRLVEEA